ncbi:hypothetical protein L1887_20585 [Cichorium endivia]|nr:hypothetical protein L1887_20585 [Cichorium endivia]
MWLSSDNGKEYPKSSFTEPELLPINIMSSSIKDLDEATEKTPREPISQTPLSISFHKTKLCIVNPKSFH